MNDYLCGRRSAERQGQKEEEDQRKALHREDIDRPWAEVIDEGGIVRHVGGEGEIGFQEMVDDQRGGLVADGNAEHDEWGFPPRLFWAPFQNDGNVKCRGDDHEVLEEEMDKRKLRRADAEGGCDERLCGGGESPKIS